MTVIFRNNRVAKVVGNVLFEATRRGEPVIKYLLRDGSDQLHEFRDLVTEVKRIEP